MPHTKTAPHIASLPPEDRKLENSTLIVATVTSFMGPFMISAVNVALPVIQAEFNISAVLLRMFRS
jgi:hypothetical protein